jgi:hypothetical protein
MTRKPKPGVPKLTPEEQAAYDDMRASPGILLDADGNVIFDGEAEAMGVPPCKTRAEIEANKAKLEAALADYRARRMREHWDTGIIMEIDGVVEFDSEAEHRHAVAGRATAAAPEDAPPQEGRLSSGRDIIRRANAVPAADAVLPGMLERGRRSTAPVTGDGRHGSSRREVSSPGVVARGPSARTCARPAPAFATGPSGIATMPSAIRGASWTSQRAPRRASASATPAMNLAL